MRDYYDAELSTTVDPAPGSCRSLRLQDFVDACQTSQLERVVEVGSGAGRDGRVMGAAGLHYTGVDLAAVGVQLCHGVGLRAVQASATALPFKNGSFDAGWTMSTLMHLPGDDIELALAELGRVIRRGGLLEVGVWGADELQTRIDDQGRYFRHRTDDQVRDLLAVVGEVVGFATWDHLSHGGHYQWARVLVDGPSREGQTNR
jgi:SAM-dependent methyltransferase